MRASFEVGSVLQVAWAGRKGRETWVPKQKVVEGKAFFCLDKWEHRAVFFFTDTKLDLRKGKHTGSIDTPFLDELLSQRNRAADEAVQNAIEVPVDGEDEQQPPKKKKRAKHTIEKQHLAPEILTIEVEGEKFECLFEGCHSSVIWLEMSDEILSRVGKKLAASKSKARKSRPSSR